MGCDVCHWPFAAVKAVPRHVRSEVNRKFAAAGRWPVSGLRGLAWKHAGL